MHNRLTDRLNADWPYPARKTPVYYGWVILLVSTLGFLMSIPGQTMGMAVFADAFIDATGLTRTQLSTAYLFGTLGSAFLLTRAGRWYDQLGARVMLVAASLLLGTMVLFLATVDITASALGPLLNVGTAGVAFPLMVLGYFGVRFAGQGVLTSASRNILLVWFEQRRGLVSGIRGVFVSLGFSISPLLIAWLMDTSGWRGALLWMAAVVGIGFTLVSLLVARNHPADCNLQVDGRKAAKETDRIRRSHGDYTLAQARNTLVFWIYSFSLSIHALFGTAVTFHIVAIFEAAGRSRAEAFAYFIPQAVVSVTTNLIASAAADHIRLKPLLLAMLVAFIAGAWGLVNLSNTWGYWLLVAGFGIGGGLWGVLSNLVFIRQYGALHLGEISGLNTSLTVTASAIGPVFFSLALDLFDTFNAAAYACIVGLIVLLIIAALVRQPLDHKPGPHHQK